MFRDREDGAEQLANALRGRPLHDPLVLAIPRGGIITGAVLARELGAELDVVLARKLRAPGQAEAALGSVGEDGTVHINPDVREIVEKHRSYMVDECRHQMAEIGRRKRLFRSVRLPARVRDRSVIVTDDGIATGATMIAALGALKAQQPRELIVAVPVGAPDRLAEIRSHCDDVVCLSAPPEFWAVSQFYENFNQVEDSEVVALLRAEARRVERAGAGVHQLTPKGNQYADDTEHHQG